MKEGKKSTEWVVVAGITLAGIGAIVTELVNSGAVDKTSTFGVAIAALASIYAIVRGVLKGIESNNEVKKQLGRGDHGRNL